MAMAMADRTAPAVRYTLLVCAQSDSQERSWFQPAGPDGLVLAGAPDSVIHRRRAVPMLSVGDRLLSTSGGMLQCILSFGRAMRGE